MTGLSESCCRMIEFVMPTDTKLSRKRWPSRLWRRRQKSAPNLNRGRSTKSALEQRSISSWVCLTILGNPKGQIHLLLNKKHNGGSDHQVMVWPSRRERFFLSLGGRNSRFAKLYPPPAR